MVMTVPPPPPPPPMYDHMDENSDSEENTSTHSADLQIEGINDHRKEEDRVTEAEKNERLQKQLMVRTEEFALSQSCRYLSLLSLIQAFSQLAFDVNRRRYRHFVSGC